MKKQLLIFTLIASSIASLHAMEKQTPEMAQAQQIVNEVKNYVYTQSPILKVAPNFFETHTPADIPRQVMIRLALKVPTNKPNRKLLLDNVIKIAQDNNLGWLAEAATEVKYDPEATKTLCSIADLVALHQLPPLTNKGLFSPENNVLDLSEKDIISVVGIDLLPNKDKIAELDLSDNLIDTLPAHAFKGLNNLEILDISNNPIETIDAQALADLTQLKNLTLMDTQLESIPHNLLYNLTNLETLHLMDNKKITKLPDKLFIYQGKLERLRLDDNQLQTVPDLFGLVHLQEINLKDNDIKTIDQNTFAHTPNLVAINLRFNDFTNIPIDTLVQALQKLKNLKYLYVGPRTFGTGDSGTQKLNELKTKLPNIKVD